MRTHSGPPTLSRRKATFAEVTALMVAMGLLTIVLMVGSPEPTPTQPTAPVPPPTDEPAPAATTPPSASDPEPDSDGEATEVALSDDDLAASRRRAEAYVVDELTWHHDEPLADRHDRLARHVTDEVAEVFAAESGGAAPHATGAAEQQARQQVGYHTSVDIAHTYQQAAASDEVTWVVVAEVTTHRDDADDEQARPAYTVTVVPTGDGDWRVQEVVF